MPEEELNPPPAKCSNRAHLVDAWKPNRCSANAWVPLQRGGGRIVGHPKELGRGNRAAGERPLSNKNCFVQDILPAALHLLPCKEFREVCWFWSWWEWPPQGWSAKKFNRYPHLKKKRQRQRRLYFWESFVIKLGHWRWELWDLVWFTGRPTGWRQENMMDHFGREVPSRAWIHLAERGKPSNCGPKSWRVGEEEAELEGGVKCVISLKSLHCHKRPRSSPPTPLNALILI